jgi:hypothetical protein
MQIYHCQTNHDGNRFFTTERVFADINIFLFFVIFDYFYRSNGTKKITRFIFDIKSIFTDNDRVIE